MNIATALVFAAVLGCVGSPVHGNIFGRSQRIRVTGRVFCPSEPAKAEGVQVKLMDEDDFGIDDTMAHGRTDFEGRFSLDGSEKEITNIDPELKLYHDCNDVSRGNIIGDKPCQRKWKIVIPDKYINGAVFDIGDVNLEIVMKGESRDCIH